MRSKLPPAIAVDNLYKSYGRGSARTEVLKGVTLDVRQGECVFLVGPSGSGKSTLLSILGCILTPDRGSVHILDSDVNHLDASARAALRRRHIGFVFQKFHLIRGLNALENVCVPLTLAGTDAAAARKRSRQVLESVGLADKLLSHPRNLSVGQCQRIALARALVSQADVILADEPTASLDAARGEEIMQLFRTLTKKQNRTVVAVTHDHRILSFADRVLTLDAGRVAQGNCRVEAHSSSHGRHHGGGPGGRD